MGQIIHSFIHSKLETEPLLPVSSWGHPEDTALNEADLPCHQETRSVLIYQFPSMTQTVWTKKGCYGTTKLGALAQSQGSGRSENGGGKNTPGRK